LPGPSFTKLKLESKILNGLNTFIRGNLSDPQYKFLTITKVELGQDNAVANIYWDCFDPKLKEVMRPHIAKLEGKFRKTLADMLSMRAVPEIRLFSDESFEAELNITKILNSSDKDKD
jgi:ribosome-binding factor A